jgi:hypothetical protein
VEEGIKSPFHERVTSKGLKKRGVNIKIYSGFLMLKKKIEVSV